MQTTDEITKPRDKLGVRPSEMGDVATTFMAGVMLRGHDD